MAVTNKPENLVGATASTEQVPMQSAQQGVRQVMAVGMVVGRAGRGEGSQAAAGVRYAQKITEALKEGLTFSRNYGGH